METLNRRILDSVLAKERCVVEAVGERALIVLNAHCISQLGERGFDFRRLMADGMLIVRLHDELPLDRSGLARHYESRMEGVMQFRFLDFAFADQMFVLFRLVDVVDGDERLFQYLFAFAAQQSLFFLVSEALPF